MSNLKITDLKPIQAEKRDFSNMDITLKRDGTLIYFKGGKLFSPRCERSERFKHILNILKEKNIPECYGEMYIDKGNVFDISRSENWNKAKFMPIDLEDTQLSYSERQVMLKKLVEEISNESITQLQKFKDYEEGWNYVKENDSEGLVIRNNSNWFKVKALKEVKIEIAEHEPSKEKGTFVLINGNRVSGTSKDFVRKFHELKAKGKIPIAEIEYPFLTEAGSYFQPRLRRIETMENLK
ncbi:MAG TPA: hypothetical protein VMZ91_15455 [Candidatus Paceibacterota bacterium]|nr:hypothetical protein [Candidatus Paceibacterota bacterium]